MKLDKHENHLTELPLRAFMLTAILAILSACDDKNGDKLPTETMDEKSAAYDKSARLPESDDKGDFPECGTWFDYQGKNMYGQPDIFWRASGWPTEEQLGCAYDKADGKNCAPIRSEGLRRIERIPDLFECDKTEQIQLNALLSSEDALIDFKPEEGRSKGDCNEVVLNFVGRIREVFRRMICKDGEPVERLGWGYVKGGEFYNPCADGKC